MTAPKLRQEGPGTLSIAGAPSTAVDAFRLTVIEGPSANAVFESLSDRCSLGSHPSNDLVLDDPTVSRFHCQIAVTADGVRLTDVGSRNGTVVNGVLARDVYLRQGSLIVLGHSTLRYDPAGQTVRIPISERSAFGHLVGRSAVVRQCFALLERAATSDATVLLEGETGTGKSRAAQAIHEASSRQKAPFVVVDCGAMPAGLLEAELFGHEKGAFTGAVSDRVGAFEEAQGGTLFLDEIGELPAELQPKLLRAAENREIRRVGSNRYRPVDVRLIAATHRDLRSEVNSGRFRSDLYYRLAVFRVRVPALREHPEDIPQIAAQLLASFRSDRASLVSLEEPAFLEQLKLAAWPGNVRELRNHLERCLAMREPLPPQPDHEGFTEPVRDASVPYPEARRRALDQFEREYVRDLISRHGGDVAQAAAASDLGRGYLYRLLRRHGVKP